MSTILPPAPIRAYSTSSVETNRSQYVQHSYLARVVLDLLQKDGTVPFFYGITQEQVYLGNARVTYVVSNSFIESVKTLAEKSGLVVSLKTPSDLGITIEGCANTAGIILVREKQNSKL